MDWMNKEKIEMKEMKAWPGPHNIQLDHGQSSQEHQMSGFHLR